MYDQIGESASAVWNYLGAKGRMDISRLPRALKIRSALAYQGVGWLAREGKLAYEQEGDKLFVALAPHEAELYRENCHRQP